MIIKRLWQDQRGVVNTTDIILVTTILGLGAIVGIVSLRNQVVQEFCDIGSAVGALDQSYSYEGRDYADQQAYFADLVPPIPTAGWLGDHSVAGSDYTDTDNLDPALSFPDPTAGNDTPEEN